MKRLLTVLLTTATLMTATAQNPFNQDFSTPHQTPPFASITTPDYEPAIDRGIALALAEVDAIANSPEAPTFANTIVALERSGRDLNRVLGVFYPLLSALSDDEMMEISMRVTPKLSDYSTAISLNENLWKRIKTVYDNRASLNLNTEDTKLLQNTYESFARNGALLTGADRDKYKELSSHLSELTTRFGQNVLKELNTYEIWLTADDLEGLPESSVEAAAAAAAAKGRAGEYLFTLDQPVYMAFMKYSARPDLREKMYKLYSSRNTKGEYNNVEIMKDIANTRLALANLLGYKTYADYSVERTMAGSPANVYALLNQLRDAYKPAQEAEFAEITKFASDIEGHPVKLMPWDYSYYSNKLKNAKYAYNEEELRPYFELSNVIDGVFGLATKLYGLQFVENPEIQVYHPDVKAYDVKDEDGSFIGVLYTDFFPRSSKRPGAWMTNFSEEFCDDNGVSTRPVVSIVMNFTKPTDTKPSLLTPYEVETFLHEFGHAIHGLLATTKYASMSGTNVYRDFVELPSQFNENYLAESEFLNGFARHYLTGEPIPQELVDKIVTSSQYGAAYACLRQLTFGLTDMAWHTITEPVSGSASDFERAAAASVSMFEPVDGTMTSSTFSHIFSGGYAAGYYSYKWSEMLDADAFAKFQETGIFNRDTARQFRTNVLERGGTEDPAELYRRFRGQEPTIDAMLRRDGIKVPAKSVEKSALPAVKN